MRRFLRRIATAARFFLLLTGLASLALWCRSYYAWDILTNVDPSKIESRTYTLLSIRSDKGHLTFDREECLRFEDKGEGSNQKQRRATKHFYYHTSSWKDPNLQGAGGEAIFDTPADEWLVQPFPIDLGTYWRGFQFCRHEHYWQPGSTSKFTFRLSLIRIPFWSITLILLAWPVLSLTQKQIIRSRRARRKKNCQCLNCGYDLRASPDQCPECGTAAISNGSNT